MPLVWELTADLKRELPPEKLREANARWRANGEGYPDAVIDSALSMLGRDDVHYEAMLGYLETLSRRPGLGDLRQPYYGLHAWFVQAIYHLLYLRHTKNADPIEARLPWLDGIHHLVEQSSPLWIFELNHDMIIEMWAARQSVPVNAGFSSTRVTFPRRNEADEKIGDLAAEFLSGADLDKGAHFFQPGSRGINLLKIHGALDIFACGDSGKDLVRLLPTAPSPKGVMVSLIAANEELFHPELRARRMNTTNEITYADDAGVMQFLRRTIVSGAHKFDGQDQVLPPSVLKLFSSNINWVTHLICIGYGFGDIHINTVIRAWLEFSADREITVVAPGMKDIPASLLHLAPQVTMRDTTANDYLNHRSRFGITKGLEKYGADHGELGCRDSTPRRPREPEDTPNAARRATAIAS